MLVGVSKGRVRCPSWTGEVPYIFDPKVSFMGTLRSERGAKNSSHTISRSTIAHWSKKKGGGPFETE